MILCDRIGLQYEYLTYKKLFWETFSYFLLQNLSNIYTTWSELASTIKSFIFRRIHRIMILKSKTRKYIQPIGFTWWYLRMQKRNSMEVCVLVSSKVQGGPRCSLAESSVKFVSRCSFCIDMRDSTTHYYTILYICIAILKCLLSPIIPFKSILLICMMIFFSHLRNCWRNKKVKTN